MRQLEAKKSNQVNKKTIECTVDVDQCDSITEPTDFFRDDVNDLPEALPHRRIILIRA